MYSDFSTIQSNTTSEKLNISDKKDSFSKKLSCTESTKGSKLKGLKCPLYLCKFLRLSSGNSITSKTYGEESLPECSLSWTSQWEKLQNPSKKQAYSEIPSFYSPQTMADRQVKVFAFFSNHKVSSSIHYNYTLVAKMKSTLTT